MFEFGKSLAKEHKNLLLHGELGAGKTLLTKWFAAWLGIDESKVQSPTYTYINIYEEKLLHIDLYRLESVQDLVEKWIKHQISESNFVVIEWPKFVEHLWIDDFTTIHIEKLKNNHRKISIKKQMSTY